MMRSIKSWLHDHPYSYALFYFIPYLIIFELLETFVVPKYYIHCFIDDMIPFHESFVIPYFTWFPLLAISLCYFLFHSRKEFLELCFMMFTGMSICLFIYMILPNGLDLRVNITHTNWLADIARLLQQIDTPTNVCPSIHVAITIAICFVVCRSHLFQHPFLVKSACLIISVFICISTMVLKQHSFIDVILGFALSSLLYYVTYHTNWQKYFMKTPLRILFS